MKKYDKDTHCPKCGYSGVGDEQYSATTVSFAAASGSTPAKINDSVTPIGGYFRRICGQCGFQWREAPLDSDETAPYITLHNSPKKEKK